ncbi:MAG: hypothetical protein LUE93_12805 [Bacteroides sp.]|nr:hypothetical protein [Bacteroides sp.]
MITSVIIASRETTFLTGKRHDHILRDCDELNESYESLDLLNFEQINYKYREEEFIKPWFSTKVEGVNVGTALLLELGPEFFDQEDERKNKNKNFLFFFRYLSPYKSQFVQLLLGMIAGSILQLILPFLTQALVDTGIRDSNFSFITLIPISQLVIFIAKLSVDFIRSWILLHVNTRINIALISDFLVKLMRMPLHFFDTKMIGDILQRIGDHKRIESFMTGSSINTLFSLVNFIVFGIVLGYYSLNILGVFFSRQRVVCGLGTCIYALSARIGYPAFCAGSR